MRFTACFLCFLCALLAGAPAFAVAQPAASSKRVALVVGNSAYDGAELPNALPDAAAMTLRLRELGFDVGLVKNTKRDRLQAAIRAFAARLATAETGLFYFAGHAVQVRGQNYLLPVDTRPGTVLEIVPQAVDLEDVTKALGTAASLQTRIVLIDACRTNPTSERFMSAIPASADYVREWVPGLARPTNPPPQTYIVFSTGPGLTASDGKGVHSPFTSALLHAMGEPGLEIRALVARVDALMKEETTRDGLAAQTPWPIGSLPQPFYFRAPAQLTVNIMDADDEAKFLLNGALGASSGSQGTRNPTLLLNPGGNTFEIKVRNHPTHVGRMFYNEREGWRYRIQLDAGGRSWSFADGEHVPPESRWGHEFTVVKGTITVDASTGAIHVSHLNTRVY